MSLSLPPATLQFIDQMVDTGRYQSRDEVVVAAVDLMRRHREKMAAFEASLKEAADELDAGLGGTINFEEVLAEGRRLFAERRKA